MSMNYANKRVRIVSNQLLSVHPSDWYGLQAVESLLDLAAQEADDGDESENDEEEDGEDDFSMLRWHFV